MISCNKYEIEKNSRNFEDRDLETKILAIVILL